MLIYVIDGPNMNLLGIREPSLYGVASYSDLCAMIQTYAKEKSIDYVKFQSNSEGDIIDCLHRALRENADGIVINPAGYTHTSVAIRDAISAVALPTVEVHVTDPDTREPFRRVNMIKDVCVGSVTGQGVKGYLLAMDLLLETIRKRGSDT